MTNTKAYLKKALTVSALVSLSIIGVNGQASFAADSSQIGSEILSEVSDYLGTDLTDSSITEALENALVEAIEAEVIDPDIVDETDSAIDDGLDVDLSDELAGNETEQEDVWTEQAPLWAAAFESVKADFQACRTSSANARDCARGLGFKLQIAKENVILTSLDERISELSTLSPEEQAAELASLTELQQQSQAKLAAAQQKLDAFSQVDVKVAKDIQKQLTKTQDKLKQSTVAVEEEVATSQEDTATSDSTESDTTTDNSNGNGNGNAGSGNSQGGSGSNGNGNGNGGNGRGNSDK